MNHCAGRINNWLGATPAVTNVQGPGRPATIDETSVKIMVGEIEKGSANSDDQEASAN